MAKAPGYKFPDTSLGIQELAPGISPIVEYVTSYVFEVMKITDRANLTASLPYMAWMVIAKSHGQPKTVPSGFVIFWFMTSRIPGS
jgi:hypothetical protein